MTIGIILHPYGEDKPAGLARIIFEYTHAFIERHPEIHVTIFLKRAPKVLPQFPGRNWNIEILGGGIFWLDRLRKKPLLDCYIFNTPALPIFWAPPKSVVIALDFAYWYFRPTGLKGLISTYGTYWYHRYSLKKADYIVSISDATKSDIEKLFPAVDTEKIRTIYFGFRRMSEIPQHPVAVQERFFLFAGVFKERKNVFAVVRAFEIFLKTHPGYVLVLVGKAEGAYAESIKEYIKKKHLESFIIEQGFVSDQELSFLYRHAQALVFPSIIEGFGFPILEAMDCGLPVITSNLSSLKEVGGDAALLVDPRSDEDIAHAMTRLADDPALRAMLVEKGFTRVQAFSWDRTVEDFLRIIKLN